MDNTDKEKIEELEKRVDRLEKVISSICLLKYKPNEYFTRDDNKLVLDDNIEITDEFAKDLYQNTPIGYKYKGY